MLMSCHNPWAALVEQRSSQLGVEAELIVAENRGALFPKGGDWSGNEIRPPTIRGAAVSRVVLPAMADEAPVVLGLKLAANENEGLQACRRSRSTSKATTAGAAGVAALPAATRAQYSACLLSVVV